MPNVEELLDGVSQIVTAQIAGFLFFTVLDLKYAYSQLKFTTETAKQRNFNIVGGGGGGRPLAHFNFGPVWLICQQNS